MTLTLTGNAFDNIDLPRVLLQIHLALAVVLPPKA